MFSMKILSIFFACLFFNLKSQECGCTQVAAQHLQWNYFYAPFYHYFITKQIVGYYKHWANAILEHEISFDGSKVLRDIQMKQVQDMSCDSKEVVYIKTAPTYDDDISKTNQPTTYMLDLIDKLINKEKVKGLREFRETFEQFDAIKTVDYPDETKLDFDWISQKFIDFRKQYNCARGYSECVKDNEKKIKTFYFIMKVDLSFEGDTPDQKRSFFIVNRLLPLHAQGNLTYKFQPYFYQHSCKDSGVGDIRYNKPLLSIFERATQHLTTSQVQKQMQALNEENLQYPNYKQIEAFTNTPIILNYFGHHDRPGISEFRTSCVHALATLRRAIELYIKLWFDPTYIIDYCPPATVKYRLPKKSDFLTKKQLWLAQMYGGDMPKIKEKEKEVEKEVIVERPAKVEPVILQKEEELVPRYKPIIHEPKIQHIPLRQSRRFQIYFLCEEFLYAIQGKKLEEKYQEKLFETGYIKFNCDYIQPKEFNPSDVWVPEDISDQEFSSRGNIYYFEEEIGFFEFSRKRRVGDYATMNLCFEAEVKFFTFFLTKQNCISERIFKSESLIEGQEELTVFSYHFGRTILEFKRMIDEIQLISLGKLRYRDIIQIGKEAFNINQQNGVATGDFIFSYGICKDEQPYFEFYNDMNSMDGPKGLVLTGYYQNLPHAPLQMTIQQNGEFYFQIEIDTGLQKAKFYYPSLLRLNRQQADDLRLTIEDTLAELTEQLKNDKVDKKKQRQILEDAKIDTRKEYLAKLFKEEHLEELQKFISNTIFRKNGLTSFLAQTAILKQQNKPTVIGEVNDAIQNGVFGQYLNSNLMNISIFATLTNIIFISLNYKRIDIDQNLFQLVTTKLPVNQISKSDIQGLEEQDKLNNIKAHYEGQCKNLSKIQFSKQYYSDYDLSQFGDWVFKQKDKGINKHMKNFIADVEAKYTETEIVYSIEQIANIINYDLNVATFLYNSNKNNFFSFIYGIEEYSSKFVVNIYQFSYDLSNTYYIYFKTFYFSSQYLLTFGSQFEFINGLINIINEVDNHFRLVVHKAMTTAFNCEKISVQDIENILDKVLDDLSQKELVPKSICKLKTGLIDNEVLIVKMNTQQMDEKGQYSSKNICQNDPDLQDIMKFTELEDSYKIEVTEIKGLQNLKFQLEQEKPARQYHSTYEFLQKNGYDYKPVLYRQIHSYFQHLLSGDFSNEIID